MLIRIREILIPLFLMTFVTVYGQKNLVPYGLLTNLLSNPELSVITSKNPKFCWIVPFIDNEDFQTAFQIQVASSSALLLSNTPDLWDSRKINSNNSLHVNYSGSVLESGKSYFWRVKIWNKNNKATQYSQIQKFNIGETERVKSWPGESRWVVLENNNNNNNNIWTLEDRHPLNYHLKYPVYIKKKNNGVWFIDFEKAAFANIELKLEWIPRPNEKSDTTIYISIGEKNIGDSIDRIPGGGIIFKTVSLEIKPGINNYHINLPRFQPKYPHSQSLPEHMPEVIPFRFCEINAGNLDISIISAKQMRLHTQSNPYASYFSSSDTLLNQIYNLCKYSVIANTFNGDYAASQRERMMYEADAYIHQLGHYAVDREFMTARYSLENMIYHATWPTEWISHSIMMVWMDYLHTGDLDVIIKNYQNLKPKALTALTMPNGLISTRTGLVTEKFKKSIYFDGDILKDIVDWPHSSMSEALTGGETDNFKFKDYNSVVNAFHYHTLILMEKMAHLIGEKKDADEYAKKHRQFYKIFQQHFFDTENKNYIDGIGSKHSSLHANLFPLAFGLVPKKVKNDVLDYIKSKDMACGVYAANYLLEGLFDTGEAEYAIKLLASKSDRSWYNMLRVGSTMTTEAWDNKYKTNNGWSHAWSSSPAHIIPRKILGIEPKTAGFKHIRIKPQLAGLSWAKGKISTIRGEIYVSIEIKEDNSIIMDILTPANTKVDIQIPIKNGIENFELEYNGKLISNPKETNGNLLILSDLSSGGHFIELKNKIKHFK